MHIDVSISKTKTSLKLSKPTHGNVSIVRNVFNVVLSNMMMNYSSVITVIGKMSFRKNEWKDDGIVLELIIWIV